LFAIDFETKLFRVIAKLSRKIVSLLTSYYTMLGIGVHAWRLTMIFVAKRIIEKAMSIANSMATPWAKPRPTLSAM